MRIMERISETKQYNRTLKNLEFQQIRVITNMMQRAFVR